MLQTQPQVATHSAKPGLTRFPACPKPSRIYPSPTPQPTAAPYSAGPRHPQHNSSYLELSQAGASGRQRGKQDLVSRGGVVKAIRPCVWRKSNKCCGKATVDGHGHAVAAQHWHADPAMPGQKAAQPIDVSPLSLLPHRLAHQIHAAAGQATAGQRRTATPPGRYRGRSMPSTSRQTGN